MLQLTVLLKACTKQSEQYIIYMKFYDLDYPRSDIFHEFDPGAYVSELKVAIGTTWGLERDPQELGGSEKRHHLRLRRSITERKGIQV